MQTQLPKLFLERLRLIVPHQRWEGVLRTFGCPLAYSLRVNTPKATVVQLKEDLQREGIQFHLVPWFEQGLVIPEVGLHESKINEMIGQGILYKQSLSSMMPAMVLDPQPGEYVLDLCAAPGSKTSQMAAMMEKQGRLVAVENIRSRYYKLQVVLKQLGVTNVQTKLIDGRRFRSQELFDKILVDAPCSSEGRFKIDHPKSWAYWSLRKIREMVRKQRGLLLNASRLLKSGGVLVYSTCTFAPEENEVVLDWLLKKTNGLLKLQPISLVGIEFYPAILEWQGKRFRDEIRHCFRVLPTKEMEGFFIAKLVKV